MISVLQLGLGVVLMAAALLGAGILVGKRLHQMQPPPPDPAEPAPPQYWVGISVYEGGDHDAAADAYESLKQQEHQLPGDREWMSGTNHVRKFKVV